MWLRYAGDQDTAVDDLGQLDRCTGSKEGKIAKMVSGMCRWFEVRQEYLVDDVSSRQ